MKSVDILCDIDMVITPTYPEWVKSLQAQHEHTLASYVSEFLQYGSMPYGAWEDVILWYENNKHALRTNYPLLDGIKPALEDMSSYSIQAITSRSVGASGRCDVTTKYLLDHELDIQPVIFTAGSSPHMKKGDVASQLSAQVLIEDSASQAIYAAKKGVSVLLRRTNYNRDIRDDNVTYWSHWSQVPSLVDEVLR